MDREIKDVKHIEDFQTGQDSIIRVKIVSFNAKEYLDIRKYYLTDSGKWLPTKKGIWLPIQDEDGNTAKYVLETILESLSSKKINLVDEAIEEETEENADY